MKNVVFSRRFPDLDEYNLPYKKTLKKLNITIRPRHNNDCFQEGNSAYCMLFNQIILSRNATLFVYCHELAHGVECYYGYNTIGENQYALDHMMNVYVRGLNVPYHYIRLEREVVANRASGILCTRQKYKMTHWEKYRARRPMSNKVRRRVDAVIDFIDSCENKEISND